MQTGSGCEEPESIRWEETVASRSEDSNANAYAHIKDASTEAGDKVVEEVARYSVWLVDDMKFKRRINQRPRQRYEQSQ